MLAYAVSFKRCSRQPLRKILDKTLNLRKSAIVTLEKEGVIKK